MKRGGGCGGGGCLGGGDREAEVGLQKTKQSFHHPLLFSLFSPALLFILLRVKFGSFLCLFFLPLLLLILLSDYCYHCN